MSHVHPVVNRWLGCAGCLLLLWASSGCQSSQPTAEPGREAAVRQPSAPNASAAKPAPESPSQQRESTSPPPQQPRPAQAAPPAQTEPPVAQAPEPPRPRPERQPQRPEPALPEAPTGTTILAVAGPSHPPSIHIEQRAPRTLILTTDNVQRMRLSRGGLPLGDVAGSLIVRIDDSGIEFRASYDWLIVERTVTGAWVIAERHPIHP